MNKNLYGIRMSTLIVIDTNEGQILEVSRR